jgi:PAS domain-containing protein
VRYLRVRSTVTTAEAARRWEHRYGAAASAFLALLGVWCYVAFSRTADPFAPRQFFNDDRLRGRHFRTQLCQQPICGHPNFMHMGADDRGAHLLRQSVSLDFCGLTHSLLSRHKTDSGTIAPHAARRGVTSRDMSLLAKRFDTALNNMPHGLCMFDAKRRIVVTNQKLNHAQLGLPPDFELKGSRRATWSKALSRRV